MTDIELIKLIACCVLGTVSGQVIGRYLGKLVARVIGKQDRGLYILETDTEGNIMHVQYNPAIKVVPTKNRVSFTGDNIPTLNPPVAIDADTYHMLEADIRGYVFNAALGTFSKRQ